MYVKYVCMYVIFMYICIDGWIDGWTDRRTDEQTDRWIEYFALEEATCANRDPRFRTDY